MKTSDELWRWIWEEDDDLRVADALRELLGPEGPPAPRPAGLEPPPTVTSESVWQWVASDEDLIDRELLDLDPGQPSADVEESAPVPEQPGAEIPAAVEVDQAPEELEEASREEEGGPAEGGRRRRVTWARWGRFGALLAVVAVVGMVAPRVVPAIIPGASEGSTMATPPEQLVVAWTVRIEESPDATFVAILASGVKPPVIVAVPADVTINVPGQGIGTVGEAAAGGDVGLVSVALENLLGVRMDGSVDSNTAELQAAVDALGTIEVADQALGGAQVIQYLTTQEPGALPDERFLRWQDVLDGIREGLATNPSAVTGFPEALQPVLAAGSPDPMALYGMPVVDLGAGLLRPDEEGLDRLVEQHFVPPAGDEVRIVVLNGVGRPGVGEEVARILVPEGYRLMSTGNANTFDLKATRIISSSEADLPAAERARVLLGVGQVLLGFQPAGLADITVVVGQDFVTAHNLGGA